jgi:hypothetical protein
LHVNPPAGSVDAKSIRSCLKCWRLIDLTVASHHRARTPNFARYPVFPNVIGRRSISIITIEQADTNYYYTFSKPL